MNKLRILRVTAALVLELLAYLMIRQGWLVDWPGIPGTLILTPPLLLALTETPIDGALVSLVFIPITYEFSQLAPTEPLWHQMITATGWTLVVFIAAWFRVTRRDQARMLVSLLVASEARTRQEVAMELHDDAIQALTAARLRLDMVDVDCKRDPSYRKALDMVVESIQRVRTLSFTLYPMSLEDGGLKPALTSLVDSRRVDFEPLGTKIELDLHHVRRYEPHVEHLMYRTFVECLQNIYKHASARRVKVTLREIKGMIHGSVIDDGRGFPTGSEEKHRLDGMGLVARSTEIRMARGTMSVVSAPNQGCQVFFALPATVRST